MKRNFSLLMLVAGIWLLSACISPKNATPTSGAYPPPGGASPYPAPESAQAQPTPRGGLEATDPTTVQLASDGPQLVEFFAFW